MAELQSAQHTEFKKENRDTLYLRRYERENKVTYVKEYHVHSSDHISFREEIDEGEHNQLLKQLVNSEVWHEV